MSRAAAIRSLLLASLSALLLGGAIADVAAAESTTFTTTGTELEWTVPQGIFRVTTSVTGANGGYTERTAPGGRGGVVSGVAPVVPGERLWVRVGRYGGANGGSGHGNGGNQGVAHSLSHDGKGGGGGSGVRRDDGTWLVVAGGGGGGGGDGDGDGDYGGDGGDGNGSAGKSSNGESPADGGCGGCTSSVDGDEGSSGGTFSGGGGGGGGGGFRGARGGDVPDAGYGGGGGGGGSSYADSALTATAFGVAPKRCSCSGKVTLTWDVDHPPGVAPYDGTSDQSTVVGTAFGRRLQARVTTGTGEPIAGALVRFQAPTNGATGRFPGGGGSTIATAQTGADGVATAPALTAGDVVGDWALTASVDGIASSARFSLSNLPAQTVLALTADANPSVYGQPVTVQARLSTDAPIGAPRGAVQFSLDGMPLGGPVMTLDGAARSLPIGGLGIGPHSIDASFSDASGTYGDSVGTVKQRVDPASTRLALHSSQNPSAAGQPLALDVSASAVAPGAGTPDGTVELTENGVSFATLTLDGQGTARTGFTPLESGTYALAATYLPAGTASDPARFGPSSVTLGQAVGAGASATTVTSSADPALFGQPVRLTATVVSAGVLAPAGAVDFALDGEPLCVHRQLELVAGAAVADCDVASDQLGVGSLAVTATYSGDVGAGVGPSQGTFTQRVEPAPTTVALTSKPDPTAHGQPIALNAEVSGVSPSRGVPAGRLQFTLDGVPFGAEQQLDASGQATLTALTAAPSGPLVVAAYYFGDAGHKPSEQTDTHVITVGQTRTALTASPDPAAPGESPRFAAHVTAVAPAFGTPTGVVQFHLHGSDLGPPVPLDADGDARSEAAAGLGVGVHDVVAEYRGAADFAASEARLDAHVEQPEQPGGGGAADAPPAPPPPTSGGGAPGGDAGPSRRGRSPLLCWHPIVITESRGSGRRELLAGVTRWEWAGSAVTLFSGRRSAGQARVRADGTFSAAIRAPKRPASTPGRATAPRDRARAPRVAYRASVRGHRSAVVGAARPLTVIARRALPHGRERIVVQTAAHRSMRLALGRQLSCSAARTSATRAVRTSSRGRTSLTVRRPARGADPFVYRLWSPRRRAYSLPLVVRAVSQ